MSDQDHRSIDWAVDIIGMCEPIRCHQGGMWFGGNHTFADATFVDYGAAEAFAVAAKSLPALVKALKKAVQFYDGLEAPHASGEAELLDELTALLGVVGQLPVQK